ncbi:MAG: pyridoxamine 5'-phosphate oxidase family protein [Nitrospiraceae bacterium]|nr:MAG: pyridoxamine 5'-phosphate oxidase family protein [Nitrospiraceae bacterium]
MTGLYISVLKMDNISELKQSITQLVSRQKLAVLSSFGKGQPYASLVAFAATEDLKYILFATTRSTRKYTNLSLESNVALLIDNRTNEETDFSYAAAATALGRAEEIRDPQRESLINIYLAKHPHLREFVTSPSCALVQVTVQKYYLVNRFQNVQELHIQ